MRMTPIYVDEKITFNGLKRDNVICNLFYLQSKLFPLEEYSKAYTTLVDIIDAIKAQINEPQHKEFSIVRKIKLAYAYLNEKFPIYDERSLSIVNDLNTNKLGKDAAVYVILGLADEMDWDVKLINLPGRTVLFAEDKILENGDIKPDSFYIDFYSFPMRNIDNYMKAVSGEKILANFYFNQALYHIYEKRNRKEALKDLQEVVRINYIFFDAWFYLGVVKKMIMSFSTVKLDDDKLYQYFPEIDMKENDKLADLKEAEVDFSKALKLNPRHVLSLNERGQIRQFLGDHQGAIADYTLAIQYVQEDKSIDYVIERGIAKFSNTDFYGALHDLNVALKASPSKRGDIYFNRAIVNLKLGNVKDAMRDFVASIKINPELFDSFNKASKLDIDYEAFFNKNLPKMLGSADSNAQKTQVKELLIKLSEADLSAAYKIYTDSLEQ